MNVRSSVQIDRPAAVVFSFITDPRYYALWHSGFLGVEVTPHGPLQVGSLIRFRTRIFMKEFETVTEIREVHLGKRLVYRGISGPFATPVRTSWTRRTEARLSHGSLMGRRRDFSARQNRPFPKWRR